MVVRGPAKLGKTGAKFWRDTTSVYELTAHELLILEGACRELDLIDRIEDSLSDAALIVSGSMGQDVANPLLAEVRQHRAAFTALIKALKLPDAVDDAPMSPRSRQAQAAAQARWARGA